MILQDKINKALRAFTSRAVSRPEWHIQGFMICEKCGGSGSVAAVDGVKGCGSKRCTLCEGSGKIELLVSIRRAKQHAKKAA